MLIRPRENLKEPCASAGSRPIARRTWENFVYKRRNVWSQPDVVFAGDGSLGDGELYVRNMGLWTVPFALARHDKGVKEFLLKLEPKLKPSLQ